MGLIFTLAGAGALLIKMYRWLKEQHSEGTGQLNSISQQAAVIGTLANAVFAILEALSSLKIASSRVTTYATPSSPLGGGIGRPAGQVVPVYGTRA